MTMHLPTQQLVQQFSANHSISQVRRPPYSPGMAVIFILFSKLKKILKGKAFNAVGTNEHNTMEQLQVN
jgi:transposase